jgi:hypothetical protein
LPPGWIAAEPISRAAAFVDRLEASATARLATAPERMLIPLGKMVLVREGG